MRTFKEHNVDPSTNLEYHSKNGIPLNENVFRVGSKAYYELFQEARKQMEEGKYTPEGVDKFLLEETDIGEYGLYEGQFVPIDCPLMEAEYKGKDVELNEPKRGGNKKFYVYVKNDKGNVIKVEFGDTSGLKAKINDPEARASFAARHQCDQKKDKTKPGYWACRLPYYAKQLGLSGGGNFFW
jgi:hypothetical protein